MCVSLFCCVRITDFIGFLGYIFVFGFVLLNKMFSSCTVFVYIDRYIGIDKCTECASVCSVCLCEFLFSLSLRKVKQK